MIKANHIKNCLNISLVSILFSNAIVPIYANVFSEEIVHEQINEVVFSNNSENATENNVTSFSTSSFKINGTVLELYIGAGGDVTIPSEVTEIADYAFRDQHEVTSVTIPSSVKKISNHAFSGCDNLSSVNLTSGLLEIGDSAFENNKALKSITIPNTVTQIGRYAFNNCSLLSMLYLGTGLSKIDESAFSNTAITSLTIPDNVTKLEGSSFKNCKSLTKVEIGNGIRSINANTFNGCENLIDVKLGNKVTNIGWGAFSNCPSLTKMVFPNFLRTIETYAFQNDKGLKSIQLGANLESIGWGAFQNCNKLTDIIWNAKISYIDRSAFYNTGIKELNLPNSLTKIESNAFANCLSLEKVTTGTGLTQIFSNMFYGCESLQSVTIKGSPTAIETNAFSDCISLTDINIPESVKKIGSSAFDNCISLKELKLSNNITTIGDGAFKNCVELETLHMPFNLNEWGEDVVYNCPKLTAYIYSNAYRAIQWAKSQSVNYELIDYFIPEAVTGLTASSYGKNKTRLTWNSVEDAEGYLIYAQKNGKYGYVGMTTKGTSFIDTKALDYDYNYYWVFPYITAEDGKIVAGKAGGYKYAKGVVPAVSNLKASSHSSGVKLLWTKQNDADGYLVYGIRPDSKYGYIGMTTKGSTFTDSKASKKDYNFYWVFPYHKDTSGKMIVGGTPKYTYGRAR